MIPLVAYSDENTAHPETPAVTEMNVGLRTRDGAGQFIVKIPSNFVASQVACADGELFLEYIPKGDSISLWSEFISVLKVTKKNNDVKQFIKTVESRYLAKGEKCSSSFHIEDGLPTGIIEVEHPTVIIMPKKPSKAYPGKNEIMVMKAVQDEDGLVILQYSRRYDIEKTPLSERKKLKEDMLKFLDSCKLQ